MDSQNQFQMTEQQWLKSLDVSGLINHLAITGLLRTREGDRAGERKLRLFGVALCRHVQRWNTAPSIDTAINVAEQFADGEIDSDELYGAQQTAEEIGYPENGSRTDPVFNSRPLLLARATSLILRFDDGWVYYEHVREALYELGTALGTHYPETDEELKNAEFLANLFRDIFGNPFRPMALDPAWQTSDVLALAHGIYDERAFDRMPILADALQDAGCTNDDILSHCRGAGPHVRGCWVVDLLLGKT